MRRSSLGALALAARHPPLWARWVLSILGLSLLTLAIVISIHRVNDSGPSQSELTAATEANRESQIVIEQDQAPHTAKLHSGVATRVALERAISADVRNRIHHGQLTSPLQSVRCTSSGPRRGDRQGFSCTVQAGGITYPFLGVVNERARALTWCKVDPVPVSSGPQEVPVSPRCRA